MFETIAEMFSYGFILRAFIVGTLVSLCAALLGVTPVSYTHLDVYKRQNLQCYCSEGSKCR